MILRGRHWFGLGFGVEWGANVVADDMSERWKEVSGKVFLGLWVWSWHIPHHRKATDWTKEKK